MKPIKSAIVSISGTTLTDTEKYMLEQSNPLGVSLFGRNIKDKHQLRALTNEIRTIVQRNNFLIATDQEGGRVCRLKAPEFREYMSQSAIGSLNKNMAETAAQLHAELIADDLHQVGINCNFAPALDVATPDITSALKSRCFGGDEYVIEKLGRIMLQIYHQLGIAACIKHFPGHSGAQVDPHLQLPIINNISERYFYPFKQMSPYALMGMTAHICLPEIDDNPITMSGKAIQEIIRGQLSFKGLLISDALEMHALKGSLQEKTRTAIEAGCEAILYCKGDIDGCNEVLDNCGYLNDESMEKLSAIENILKQKYQPNNITEKEQTYQQLYKQATHIQDDYDAVEVLNQL